MTALRLSAFALIFLVSAGFIYVLAAHRVDYEARPSFSAAFQLAGKPVKLLDRALSRVIPVDELDERELGEALAAQEQYSDEMISPAWVQYLDDAAAYLSQFAKKPFRYRIYVHSSSWPNAFALPGGVIFVSQGLLDTLHSESELIAVLAHEMGHIELGHCFESFKFTLLARKMHAEELGTLADVAYSHLVNHTFSKTQENEADEYAFAMLTESIYDPRALGSSFARLSEDDEHANKDDLSALDEYLATHPTLESRARKFSAEANQWWIDRPHQKRIVGVANFRAVISATRRNLD